MIRRYIDEFLECIINIRIKNLYIYIVFLFNIIFSSIYIFSFDFPSNITKIEGFCPNDFWEICFIPDTRDYALRLNDFRIKSIFDNFIFLGGGISHHLIVYIFSNAENIIFYSILLNSLFVALIMREFKIIYRLTSVYRSYLFLMPFFTLYSIGPTKEILLLYGSLLTLNYKFGRKNIFGVLLVLVSRNVFLPLLLFARFIRLNLRSFCVLVLLISILLPFIYKMANFNFYVYDLNRLSQFFESLKYEFPILSLLGILVNLLKNIFEPYIYIVKSGIAGLTNLVIMINFFYFTVLYYLLYRYRYLVVIFKSKEFNFLLISSVFLATYPLVQQRYLLVPALILIFYIKSALRFKNHD